MPRSSTGTMGQPFDTGAKGPKRARARTPPRSSSQGEPPTDASMEVAPEKKKDAGTVIGEGLARGVNCVGGTCWRGGTCIKNCVGAFASGVGKYAPPPDDTAVMEDDEVQELRQELGRGYKMSMLRKRAEAHATEEEIQECEDSDDPKAALIDLIVKKTPGK